MSTDESNTLSTKQSSSVIRPSARVAEGTRKRARTRAHLIDTAIELFAQNGTDATSVLDISKQAGVSNGTFYYHFRDKDEIVREVGAALTKAFVHDLALVSESIDNPAERVAIGVQWLIRRALTDPEVARILSASIREQGDFRNQTTVHFVDDVEQGVRLGLFDTPIDALLLEAISATTAWAIQERLAGVADAEIRAAEIHLRLLGIDPRHATELASEAKDRLDTWPIFARP